MESKMDKKDDWIKLSSKSRAGRFYLFNKATGESQWLPLGNESSNEAPRSDSKKETPPKLPVSKPSSKTPAQDRLKRLQHNLKANQIRSQPTKTSRHTNDSPPKTKKTATEAKEQENRVKDEPTTSSTTKGRIKSSGVSPRKPLPSSRRANKRPHLPTEQEKPSKRSTSPTQTSQLPETLNTSTPSTTNKNMLIEAEVVVCKSSTSLASLNDTKHLQNEVETKSSTLNNLRTGIVKKIKEICKFPFSTSKKPPDEQAKENKSSSLSSVLKTTPFKPAKKTKDNKCLSASLQKAISEVKADQEKSTDNSTNTSVYSTPKNLNIPTYQRGSANTRLERLRQSLQMQQPSTSKRVTASLSVSSSVSENSEATNVYQQQTAFSNNSNIFTNSTQIANNTRNDEPEAMDWQPILKDEPKQTSSSDSNASNVFKPTSSKKVHSDNEGTMGDIYDTVNENLLRFSAEKHKDTSNDTKKWQKEYYYFVVDTNVFLRNLCFIDDLSKMKLCDTVGSMLYIPYCVLQELDILKMRSGAQEGVKTLAVRAIKYLNKKLESNSSHLQAQSALEERNRLIKINCADDSIINCCLQVKKHVPNLLLLTEDVNLRNKAICNNILVSTKSDLASKHYDTNDDDKS